MAPLPTVHNSESEHDDCGDEERFSGSQEGNFSSGEGGEIKDQVHQNVSVCNPAPFVIGRSPTNSNKASDTPSSLGDLRDFVYSIMRDVNKVPNQSPMSLIFPK